MKFLTLESCITLLGPCSLEQAKADESQLPGDLEGPGWLEHGVSQGWFQSTGVSFNGEPVGRLYYYVTDQKGLNLTAGVSLVKRDVAAIFEAAMHKLARSLGCKSIVTCTRRPGLVRKYTKAGFEIVGVQLRKNLA